MVRDREIADEAGRYGAAARLDAPAPVEQRDLSAVLGEIISRGGARRAAPNDDNVKNHVSAHDLRTF
jgi:hypothetical protein